MERSEPRRPVPGRRRSPAQCGAFSGGITTFYAADGVELAVLGRGRRPASSGRSCSDMRVGVMFYYRTNRDQLGVRNTALPPSAYTPFTVTVPNGPAVATTATVVQPRARPWSARSNQHPRQRARARHRLQGGRVHREQAVLQPLADGGGTDASAGTKAASADDLNDPNETLYRRGIIGNDSKVGFRLSGSYLCRGEITLAGSLVSNTGLSVTSRPTTSRGRARRAGVTLTRASQTVHAQPARRRAAADRDAGRLRISRAFQFGSRSIVPTARHLQHRERVDRRQPQQRRRRDLPRATRNHLAADHPRRVRDRFLTGQYRPAGRTSVRPAGYLPLSTNSGGPRPQPLRPGPPAGRVDHVGRRGILSDDRSQGARS